MNCGSATAHRRATSTREHQHGKPADDSKAMTIRCILSCSLLITPALATPAGQGPIAPGPAGPGPGLPGGALLSMRPMSLPDVEADDRADDLYSDGREAIEEGRYERALDRFNRLIEMKTNR